MFLVYLSDTPTREVKGEEYLKCDNCKETTLHHYEVVSFHASVMFVKLFCSRQRYIRICSKCGGGSDMTEEEFNRKVQSLMNAVKKAPRKQPAPIKTYKRAKDEGITFCNNCGGKIFPDLGYCASCAVRKNPPPAKPAREGKPPAKKTVTPASSEEKPKAPKAPPEKAAKPAKRAKSRVISTLNPYGTKKK